jgi:hypothetical protein
VTARRWVPNRATGRRLLARARHPARRAAVLALIAGAIVVAVALDLAGSTAAPRATVPPDAGPTVPASGAVSAAWYCAEGTGSSGGRADETIWIANVGDADARADITVMPGGDVEPTSRRVTVPRRGQLRVPVSSVLETAEQADPGGTIIGPGVVVEVFGSRAIVEHEVDGQAEGQRDVGVGACAREPARDWYFAAGTTERGAEQRLALFNPFADDAILDLSFATDVGFVAPADLQSLVVPRRSRVTVPVASFVRRQPQIGAHVNVRVGRVVAEQSLVFTSENENRRGLTLSLGATAPARSWTLPGVVAGDGVANGVFVANFDPTATEVELTPRFEDESSVAPSRVAVPGRSTVLVDLGPFAAPGVAFDVQVRTTGNVPVVAEGLAAWGPAAGTVGAATAVGNPQPARDWVFALGRLAAEDAAALSVFNAGAREANVKLIAYESGSDLPASERELTLAASKQATFDLGELGIAPDHLIVVHADEPVVAARRILGPSGASLAPGIPDPHAR